MLNAHLLICTIQSSEYEEFGPVLPEKRGLVDEIVAKNKRQEGGAGPPKPVSYGAYAPKACDGGVCYLLYDPADGGVGDGGDGGPPPKIQRRKAK